MQNPIRITLIFGVSIFFVVVVRFFFFCLRFLLFWAFSWVCFVLFFVLELFGIFVEGFP